MSNRCNDSTSNGLSPENVKLALVRAGTFLTGYELVKTSIVDGVKDFFLTGFNEEGPTYSPNYATEVLPLGKGTFRASVAWLVARGALSAEQAGQLDAISDHRHEIAHELARLLVDPKSSIDTSQLSALIDVLHSLDIFWGTIELETSEGFDPDQIDYQGIRSGWGLLLDYLAELSELKNVTNAKAGH